MPPPDAALPFYVCLAGPTAAGKTAAALAIASRIPTEIISVDSALVYQGMDIGTAKPSAQELAQVPHHLIDIRDPLHAYSAAEFVRDAHTLIRDIASRGRLPLLVGGTMLYFKALQQGLNDMPAANPAVRAALEAEAREHGWPALHAELAQVDHITAARLSPNDSQRIQRALEVYRVSGKPLSAFQTRVHKIAEPVDPGDAVKAAEVEAVANLSAATNLANVADADAPLFSLEPADRAWLHQRIAQRFEAMLSSGFLDEVQALRARGDLHLDLPSIRCVGYRQAWEALDGLWPAGELRDRGIFATRQLAKRQITWLRSMPHRHIIACDAPDALPTLLDKVLALVASQGAQKGNPP